MKLKLWLLAICLAALWLGLATAWASDMQLVVNELKIFPVSNLHRVAVGDPEIADISVLSDKELMIIAKKAGSTSLIVWDDSGQRSYNIIVIEQDLEKVAQKIRGLLASADVSGVNVKTEGDKVYAVGEVLTQREAEKIKGILAPFANAVNLVQYKERQPLVEIDINVLEVAYKDQKNLGLDWSNALPIKYSESTTVDGKAPKVWKVFSWDRTTVNARWNFLVQENKVRTLANPKLVTLSGQEASFLVGGEIPYITVETEGRTRVEWKDYGINLKILPLVNADREIKTRIEAEVSELDSANAVTHQGYNIPAFKKRQAETELFLNEGDTVFLAGLIKNENSRDVDRLPWLGKLPILGELFKSSEFKDNRTELVISITPRLIDEEAQAKQGTRQGEKEGVSSPAQEESPLSSYGQMIAALIAQNAVYPEAAREENLEGVVEIDLRLLATGELKEAKIKHSSGSVILDEAALSAVEEIAPYPAFPPKLAQKELRLSVPVAFKSYAQNE